MSTFLPEENKPKYISSRSLVQRIFRFILMGLFVALLAGCHGNEKWHNTVMTGYMPDLSFTMTRARDGKQVTAADYRGKVVLLYFGYTYCPDICPTTMATVTTILKKLGAKADQVRVLFVTVDPNRDTLDILKSYTAQFAPQIVGLRGTPEQLAAFARRYRVPYSVTTETKDHPYQVTHSSAIYVFDKKGAIRLLLTSLSTKSPDIDGTVSDLRRLTG